MKEDDAIGRGAIIGSGCHWQSAVVLDPRDSAELERTAY